MALLYLLKNLDRYTSHLFSTFYWKSYVQEVRPVWSSSDESPESPTDLVVIGKKGNEYVPVSAVDHYIYRPEKYADVSLYDWMCLAVKYKVNKKRSNITNDNEEDSEPDVQVEDLKDESANINVEP